MISVVKDNLSPFLGRSVNFRYNGSRNQIEEFSGVIKGLFSNVFIVVVSGRIRCFSYSDVLIGTLEVDI